MADLVTLAELNDALNLEGDTSHDDELQTYIDAVTAHVERHWGELPSAETSEIALVVDRGDGTLRISTSKPVLEVASLTDGETTYTDDFTVSADGYVEHDDLIRGRWTITYTAGYAAIPADLKLAVTEDIRGLYQPGQIGPPAAFGQFGIESTETGDAYRPVRMWPRVDAWLASNVAPRVG